MSGYNPAPGEWGASAGDDDPGRRQFTFHPAGAFILDTAKLPAAWWGAGSGCLATYGEALMIAGPQGTGKSTVAQQLALGRAGFGEYADLLGFPITPGRRRVLYLAMDRPRQIARGMARMVGTAWRDDLDDRLSVWVGPPPYDLAKHPSVLLALAEAADADTVVVDSIKDAAIGISDDEVGAGFNRARQAALAAGVELIEVHHTRKALNGGRTSAPTIDDIYGSTWLTSGAGSVLLLGGAAGDPIVTMHQVKQPADEVGPLKVIHDAETGRSTVWHAADLASLARVRPLTALDAASALFETDKPTPAEREKARRRLDQLTRAGRLTVVDDGDQAAGRPRLWGAA